MTLLTTEALTLEVDGRRLVEGLALAIRPGERWCVLGNNGTGKTRLLETLLGLHPPAAGAVHLDGRALSAWPARARARRIGLLAQHEEDPFPLTVEEAVRQGGHPWRRDALGLAPLPDAVAERIEAAVAALELAPLRGRNVQTLSGGERRRVAAATLLVQAPRLFLLDEPTNHLDLRHRPGLLRPFLEATGRGHALVLVTHALELVEQVATHVLFLYGDGRWRAGVPEQLLTRTALEALYGVRLEACRTPQGRRLWYVPDEVGLRPE
ncbi:MAG: ABC transporter ATP-binding protein [Gammaproteobacteria bacterium]|nr:MAG: ABC transporter ATP-binding protein [Gammaproteobacteria bacterium]